MGLFKLAVSTCVFSKQSFAQSVNPAPSRPPQITLEALASRSILTGVS